MVMIYSHLENNSIFDEWKQINQKELFIHFDTFIIREMGMKFRSKKELEDKRRPAFLQFRKKTKKYDFASLPTIRRWFGIGGRAKPSREQIYQICIQLGESRKKAEEYLTIGLGEEAFQYSDYKELIYIYALDHGLECKDCKRMIKQFEKKWDGRDIPEFKEKCNGIKQKYKKLKTLKPEEFMEWMLQHRNWLKGYNQKTVDVLRWCRSEINQFVREESRERLESLLAETDYAEWVKKRENKAVGERENIRRYIRTYQNTRFVRVSENMEKNLLELNKIVNTQLETNSKLLSEVFASSPMSSKRLSDLFNLPKQKTREIYAYLLREKLDSEDFLTQKNIVNLLKKIDGRNTSFHSLQEIERWIEFFLHNQKRRCPKIQRQDLLPMVHYIAQHQYMRKMEKEQKEYNREDAKNEFIQLANEKLKMCYMAPFSERYDLDFLLISCFQKEEMYSYCDAMDALKKEIFT